MQVGAQMSGRPGRALVVDAEVDTGDFEVYFLRKILLVFLLAEYVFKDESWVCLR